MRNHILHWCILLSLWAVVPPIAAQDEGLYRFYYEQPTPNRLDWDLLRMNICLESVLLINEPDFDFVNVEYGDSLWIPQNPQLCYQYDEERAYGWWNFSEGYPPRLKFYENGAWLDEPYYSDEVVYLQAESLAQIITRYNVCEDVLLAENILLQAFDQYKDYPIRSMDVFIPKDAPPCDPDWVEPPPAHLLGYTVIDYSHNQLTPGRLVQDYNVCVEEVGFRWQDAFYRGRDDSIVSLSIPNDAPPCYNEAGQRLSYYDEMGEALDEPVYSDLPVFVVPVGWSVEFVAITHDVCLLDLLRVNHFPILPVNVPVEMFIPPSQPCPDGLAYQQRDFSRDDLLAYSAFTDICSEVLWTLNPHLWRSERSLVWHNPYYNNPQSQQWVVQPKETESCYQMYKGRATTRIFDIERETNVCYQDFLAVYNPWVYDFTARYQVPEHVLLYYRYDVKPCYNAEGQRLDYGSLFRRSVQDQVAGIYPDYSPLPVHIFARDDTAYTLSQRYNVCVPDILAENPLLVSQMPTGLPVFIPQTRPCYDKATGLPLIYTDENGEALPEPQVAEQLIHYGGQQMGYISHYYNVCRNRIEDANREKLDGGVGYLGWIIPTDRPDCYDMDGNPLHYVCYDEALDPQADYQRTGNAPAFGYNGIDCHDIFAPDTVIWYADRPYKAIRYDGTPLESRAFTAWCYGVSLSEIDAINDEESILTLLPRNARMIPMPTRDCYLDHPEMLERRSLHQVKTNDTLYSIAQEYNKPYQWLAWVNGLDVKNSIWAGQTLIIPAWRDLLVPVLLIFGLGGVVIMLYWIRRRKQVP